VHVLLRGSVGGRGLTQFQGSNYLTHVCVGEPRLNVEVVRLAVWISVYVKSACSAPRRDRGNNQDFLPKEPSRAGRRPLNGRSSRTWSRLRPVADLAQSVQGKLCCSRRTFRSDGRIGLRNALAALPVAWKAPLWVRAVVGL
jgi:hypothetical protein